MSYKCVRHAGRECDECSLCNEAAFTALREENDRLRKMSNESQHNTAMFCGENERLEKALEESGKEDAVVHDKLYFSERSCARKDTIIAEAERKLSLLRAVAEAADGHISCYFVKEDGAEGKCPMCEALKSAKEGGTL